MKNDKRKMTNDKSPAPTRLGKGFVIGHFSFVVFHFGKGEFAPFLKLFSIFPVLVCEPDAAEERL